MVSGDSWRLAVPRGRGGGGEDLADIARVDFYIGCDVGDCVDDFGG